jgi:hypothetical protein
MPEGGKKGEKRGEKTGKGKAKGCYIGNSSLDVVTK